jgi:hypothetical protein
MNLTRTTIIELGVGSGIFDKNRNGNDDFFTFAGGLNRGFYRSINAATTD